MLVISPTASAAINALMESPRAPEGGGVRLASGGAASDDGTGGAGTIALSVVPGPEPQDAVLESPDGADVFVEPDAAAVLDDKVLDADVSEQQVTFLLRPQDEDGGEPEPEGGAA